jgi:N-acetylglucosaminyldiphosphoundecaprenol N-acetyl-beta-D-mannosaminyltransferase
MGKHKRKILKTEITLGSYSDTTYRIIKLGQNKSSYVCLANAHMAVESYDDKEFKDVVNGADLVVSDGISISKGIQLLYSIKQSKIAGMDLIETLFSEIAKKDLKVFLYGSTREVLLAMIVKAQKQFTGLRIVGILSPPFRELTAEEAKIEIDVINNCNPDFVFVALGCPKQEKWMAHHKGKINSCMVGFGGAFLVYAGAISRAPKWMQSNGLEWLYRLYKEPKRLWRRYLYTNIKFIILLSVQFIKVKLSSMRTLKL